MKPPFQSSERTHRLIDALKKAVTRLDQSRMVQNSSDSFAPLGEALLWVATLDTDFGETCGDAYRDTRDKHEFGKVVLGHRYARNLLCHDRKAMDLVDVVEGVYFPVRSPVCPFELKWKRLSNLPKNKRRDELLANSYHKNVENRLARETLREALAFFLVVIDSADPH